MSTLDVPGAQLHYETHGHGPLMVLIPGAAGHGRVFTALTARLAQHRTVVTYDRRGFSRSHLDGTKDDANRLSTDAMDVVRLIRHLGEPTATVFGTSSGGVVALQLLIEHPDVVDVLVPYEPAALRLLPPDQQQRSLDLNDELYELYRQQGPAPALAQFREAYLPEPDKALMNQPVDPDNAEEALANATYWFEHELRQYTSAQFDHDVLLHRAPKVLPAVGRASRGYTAYETGTALATKLGRSALELPGGHLGYATDPASFANELLAALR